MATRNTATRQPKLKSSRTPADAQPLPRLSPPSARQVHLLTLGDADKVVQWLNASKGTASHDRVVHIRRELEALPVDYSAHGDAFFNISDGVLRMGEARTGNWPKEKLQVQWRLGQRYDALQKALSKYIFHPTVTYVMGARKWLFFGMVPDGGKRWYQMCIGQQLLTEADAVIALLRLAETGDLHKVRLCEMCHRHWLVAARRNSRFCSQKCREAFYAKSPDYHSRKAANQRKYRENLKRTQAARGF